MKRVKLFLVSLLSLLFVFTACQKDEIELLPEEQKMEDGFFAGLVYSRFPVAYEIDSNEIIPLGSSAELEKIMPIDVYNFTAIPENKNFSPFICKRIQISRDDYQPADNEQTKNFGGLWFAMNENNLSYNGGLVMAIKPMDDHWEVTLTGLNGHYSKVTGKTTMVDGHQELTFQPGTEITGGGKQTWVLSAPGITGYDFKVNILNLKTTDGFSQGAFQFIAIHNKL